MKVSEVIICNITRAIKGKTSYFIAGQQPQHEVACFASAGICTFIGHYYPYLEHYHEKEQY